MSTYDPTALRERLVCVAKDPCAYDHTCTNRGRAWPCSVDSLSPRERPTVGRRDEQPEGEPIKRLGDKAELCKRELGILESPQSYTII